MKPEVNPGWEERYEQLRNAPISAVVFLSPEHVRGLTPEEVVRLQSKVRLVADFAVCLVRGMLKGTVKYVTDRYDVATWQREADDDYVDAINYRLLLQDAQGRGVVAASPPTLVPDSNGEAVERW